MNSVKCLGVKAMQEPKYTGGPAFPLVYENGNQRNVYAGMSLLDYFAAQTMPYLLQNDDTTIQEDAEMAYVIAGAMLKAREQ